MTQVLPQRGDPRTWWRTRILASDGPRGAAVAARGLIHPTSGSYPAPMGGGVMIRNRSVRTMVDKR